MHCCRLPAPWQAVNGRNMIVNGWGMTAVSQGRGTGPPRTAVIPKTPLGIAHPAAAQGSCGFLELLGQPLSTNTGSTTEMLPLLQI